MPQLLPPRGTGWLVLVFPWPVQCRQPPAGPVSPGGDPLPDGPHGSDRLLPTGSEPQRGASALASRTFHSESLSAAACPRPHSHGGGRGECGFWGAKLTSERRGPLGAGHVGEGRGIWNPCRSHRRNCTGVSAQHPFRGRTGSPHSLPGPPRPFVTLLIPRGWAAPGMRLCGRLACPTAPPSPARSAKLVTRPAGGPLRVVSGQEAREGY